MRWVNSPADDYYTVDNIRTRYSENRLGKRVDAYLTRYEDYLSATNLKKIVDELILSNNDQQAYKYIWTDNGAKGLSL